MAKEKFFFIFAVQDVGVLLPRHQLPLFAPRSRTKLVRLAVLLIAWLMAAGVVSAPLPARQGEIQRLMTQAYRYYTGFGVPLSRARALKLYLRAAELGDAEAQFIVAGMYYRGLGTDKNRRAAFKWFLRAAEQGRYTARSLTIIGSMYLRGTGVPQNYREAEKWLGLAVQQGSVPAMNDLAFIWYNGLTGKKDFRRALALYRQAASQGDIQAQYNVGLMYANGIGVPVDMVRAYAWYSLAASQGNTSASIARNNIVAAMNWQELTRAQALSVRLFREVEQNREKRALQQEGEAAGGRQETGP